MPKNHIKIEKSTLIMAMIFLIVLGIFGYFSINSSENKMFKTLDQFEDDILACSLELSNSIADSNFPEAKYQATLCRKDVNEALIEINKWHRDNPTDETYVAKLDYGASLSLFNAVSSLADLIISVDYGASLDTIKAERTIELLDEALENINEIEKTYSQTKYYERYYVPKLSKIEDTKNEIKELRSELQSALTTQRVNDLNKQYGFN